jgi:hypothetical protein
MGPSFLFIKEQGEFTCPFPVFARENVPARFIKQKMCPEKNALFQELMKRGKIKSRFRMNDFFNMKRMLTRFSSSDYSFCFCMGRIAMRPIRFPDGCHSRKRSAPACR